MVSGSISLPCSGYFSPFPHGTRSLSVRQEYLGLSHGRDRFARDSTGPVLLGRRDRQTMRVRVRGPHPLRPGIQPGSPGTWFYATDGRPVGAGKRDPSTPRAQPPTGITRARFGLIRFRSPLLTEYPFLQVLRCFTSLRTPRTRRYRPMTAGGFPHSEILGSKPCWRLPEAYRSLKRPSSVLSAKASTIRPCRQHAPHGAHGRKDPS